MSPGEELRNLCDCIDMAAKNCNTFAELGIVYVFYAAILTKCRMLDRALQDDKAATEKCLNNMHEVLSVEEKRVLRNDK